MNSSTIIVLVVLFIAAGLFISCRPANDHAATSTAPIPPIIPLRDFFKNSDRTAYQISEDGKTISFLAPYENRLNLFVQPREGGEAKRITSVTDRDIAGYYWKGGDHLFFLRDFGGDENYHLFCVDKDGKQTRDLTPFPKVRVEPVARLRNDPEHILIQMNKRDAKVFDVFRLHVVTGELQLVAQNPGNITGWQVDFAGRVRVATTTDGVNTSLLYRETEKDEFKTILTTNFREQMSPYFFTFDNKYLYCGSNIGRDKAAIVTFDPRTGKEIAVIAENPEVDMGGLSISYKRKVITYADYTTDKEHWQFFDAETKELYEKIRAKLPGYEIASLDNCDRAEENFIIHAYNDRTRGADYLYEKVSGKLTKLCDRAPWLKEAEMAPMKPVTYTARDGLAIHGYLTLPVGRPAKNLPVVINPHGGPWHRDEWGFNPEVQFLANRGYAVLQINFRGSTGYGRKFWEASFKQWGLAMQDDVTDGAQWLIKEGIADPKRVAIYGASYGGYATLAGVTYTPDLYAAAVDYVGVSNLFTFMNTFPPYWEPARQMMYEMVGDPVKDKELLARTSPALHADKIKTPLFIAQGANDPRVNKNESDQMVEALKKRGVAVEYMVKDNEGHGFHNEENRFEFYEAMEKFLSKHLNAPQEK